MPATAGASTLAGLLDALGSGVIDVLTASHGLDTAVGEPVVFDAVAGMTIANGDVVLAVGVDPESAQAFDVVEATRQAGGVAVVFQAEVPPASLVRAGESAGVVLLAVPLGTAWGQLFTLLRTARGARAPSEVGHRDGTPQVGDLFSLANAIASIVGGATTIEDLQSNVLAYSNLGHPIDKPRQDTILGRRVPHDWSAALVEAGVFRELYRTDDVVRIPTLTRAGDDPEQAVEYRPRLAITVRAGGEALGSIWVMEGPGALPEPAEDGLRAAAQIAAMHLLHHRASTDMERLRRTELLRTLLEGDRPGQAIAALRMFGKTPLAVLAFEPAFVDEDEPELELERLVDLLTLQAKVFRRHAHAVWIGSAVYVVLRTSDVADRTRLRSLAEDLRRRTERSTKRGIKLGIGSAVDDPRELHRSRAEADQVLTVLRRNGENIGDVDELRGAIALARLEELMADEPLLRAGKVAALVEHDAKHHTSHVTTLLAYLDSFGDVVAAAASINIHRNTFRYRLGRIAELSGIDLGNPDERLITHLQLRLPALSGAVTTDGDDRLCAPTTAGAASGSRGRSRAGGAGAR